MSPTSAGFANAGPIYANASLAQSWIQTYMDNLVNNPTPGGCIPAP